MLTLALTSQLINTNGRSRPDAGEILEYTLTLTNEGTDLLTGLTISDSIIDFDLTGFSGELAAGAMIMLTGSYEIQQTDLDKPQNAPLLNTTTVTDNGGQTIAEQSNSTPLTRITVLQIAKGISGFVGLDDGIYNAGDQVEYSYNVTNDGNATLFNVTLTDNDGITPNASVSLSNLTDEDNDGENDDLAVGATAIGSLLSAFSQAQINQGFVTSFAQGTAFNSSGFPVPASGSAVVQIDRLPAIAVEKTATPGQVSSLSETITYDYKVTNTGNISLLNVTLVDDNGTPASVNPDEVTITPLSGLTDLDNDGDADDLAVGQSATGSYTIPVTQAILDAGNLINNVVATGIGTNGATVTDDDDAEVLAIAQPSIKVTKEIQAGTVVTNAGDTVPYNYTVTNDGNVSLLNVTLIDDNGTPLDTSDDVTVTPLTGLTDLDNDGDADDLAVDDTAEGSYVGTVSQEAIDAGVLTNIVVGTGTSPAGEDVTDDDIATISAAADPAIDVTKTVRDVIDSNSSTTTDLSDAVIYDYSLTNTGNVSLLNVTLVDDNGTPGDLTDDVTVTPLNGLTDRDNDGDADDLAVDATATGSYTGSITQAAVDAGNLTNIVVGMGTSPDGQTVEDEDDATVPTDGAPAIEVVKTIAEIIDTNGNAVNDAGDGVVYNYSLSNTGNVSLLDVQLLDDNGTPGDTSDDVIVLPLTGLTDLDNDGDADDLAVDATATGSYTGSITQAAVDAGELTNIVIGTGISPTGQTVEDQDDATVETVLPDPGISLNKLTSGDGVNFFDPANITEAVEVAAGETVYWRYEVTNSGNVAFAADDLSIRDDNGTPGDSSDDFDAILDATSDANSNGLLDSGETWIYNASATAQDLSFSLDFDTEQSFSAGDDATIINAAYSDLEISTTNIPGVDDTTNRAMIFDTANPTGGDFDLGTPGQASLPNGGPGIGRDSGAGVGNTVAQGNVLIISEDGDSSDPDDNADGGTLNFAWTHGPVRLTRVGLLDIDVKEDMVTAQSSLGGADLTGYDAQNLGDNSHQTIALGGEWADQLAINFVHSGAVTGLAGIGSYSNQATVSATFNGTVLEASADSYYTNSLPPVIEPPAAPAPTAPAASTDVLFVTGFNNAKDQMLQQQLSDRGFNVTTIDDQAVTPTDDDDKDLILISESVLSSNVGGIFADSAAAIMTWEAYLYDDLGMTGLQANVDFGWTRGSEVLSGGDSISVYENRGRLSWARPGSEATTLATLDDGSDRAAIFAYDTGAMLASGVAAAGKRVGFFAHSYASPFSEEGLALFNTAVDYAVM